MNSPFVPFDLERFMSIWENQVEINVSESGVHPLSIRELVGDDHVFMEKILNTNQGYPQTNGIVELREKIASLYPGATDSQVVVTIGAAQAEFTTLHSLMQPGDEIAVMIPNYMLLWGVAKNMGLNVKTFSLKEELNWGLDIQELNRVVTPKTKMIAICNPDNPTGHILPAEERAALVAAASRCGAWILTDEVYAGAERLTDEFTPSMWNDYDKVLAIGSMSKAYALPGLRIGWVVSPGKIADDIWARQDYITICTTMLSNHLAAYALTPGIRERILERTRKHVRNGYQAFEDWCNQHPGFFTVVPPEAAAFVFPRYNFAINSSTFVEKLIELKKAYVVPGDHFGLDHHLRISYGMEPALLNDGLQRIYDLMLSMNSSK